MSSKDRGRVCKAVADMMRAMQSDSRTVGELMELTGMVRESVTAWVNALEDVGILAEGARRKITGQGGSVARTWRMP